MIDWIKTIAKDLEDAEIDAIRRGKAFTACWDGVQDKYGREQVKWQGLTISMYSAKRMVIVEGALPTFANGNNLHLLTYPEMVSACAELAAAVGLPGYRLPLVGIELSNDLDSTTSPQPFLQSLQYHKGSKFAIRDAPKGTARPQEYIATHADYRAKLYDKGAAEARRGNSLPSGQHRTRFEVVMTRARPINALWNRSETTLADLTSLEFYAAAALELEQQWKAVVRTQPLDLTGLKGKDRLLLGAGANPEWWRGLKADRALITYKRTRKRYRELVKACAKRVGPDEFDQRFAPALAALLPPVATTQNDTLFHTSSLLGLPSMRVVKETAPPLVNDAGAGGLLPSPPARLADDDEREQSTTAARCCLTCGAPIASHRKPEAQYCGKQCRNAASNPGHNARRTLRKIESQWQLFDQRPFVRVPEQIRAFVLAA